MSMREDYRLKKLRKVICDFYGISWNDIFNKSREEHKKDARLIFSYIAYEHLNISQTKIAIYCGKSKVAVYKNIASVRDWCYTDPKYTDRVDKMIDQYQQLPFTKQIILRFRK